MNIISLRYCLVVSSFGKNSTLFSLRLGSTILPFLRSDMVDLTPSHLTNGTKNEKYQTLSSIFRFPMLTLILGAGMGWRAV